MAFLGTDCTNFNRLSGIVGGDSMRQNKYEGLQAHDKALHSGAEKMLI
jgi:hypothetical protein